jgi:hypothetical protein
MQGMKLFFTIFFTTVCAGFAGAQASCDSWVNLQNRFAAITVGDLDVTGNQITVEASFNMTGPSVDIVSKHWGGFDVNYLLRPVRAEITTTNSGFVTTGAGAACTETLVQNKTYHVALVYNGSMLKFYRNGALISEAPASGNLVTNNWDAAIGEHAPVVTPLVDGAANPDYQNSNEWEGFYDESFRGFINEVRIWNIARTQDQIKAYMNTSLPDPTTQTGLLGYWIFNDLLNKQGNAAFNAKIEGLATIGQTNTSCNFIADSCNIVLPVKLTGFAAVVYEKTSIQLNWHTAGENGITTYSIQRAQSPYFRQYENVGTVHANAQRHTNSYSFTDHDLAVNTLYFYRLKITAADGSVSYSDVRTGKIATQPSFADIYPNPTTDGIVNIRFNEMAGTVMIDVLNSTGQVLINKQVNALAGNASTVDLGNLSRGSYFVRIRTSDNKVVKRIIRL